MHKTHSLPRERQAYGQILTRLIGSQKCANGIAWMLTTPRVSRYAMPCYLSRGDCAVSPTAYRLTAGTRTASKWMAPSTPIFMSHLRILYPPITMLLVDFVQLRQSEVNEQVECDLRTTCGGQIRDGCRLYGLLKTFG